MSIGSIGMAGGMDVNAMVKKVVDAERLPKQQQIDASRQQVQSSISAYGKLRESLDTMKNLMSQFRQDKAFAVRKVDTNDDTIVTATATTDAIAGQYTIDVLQLAQSHKVASQALPEDAKFGPGKMTISLGEKDFSINVRSNTKLTDVVRTINAVRDNPGVRASIINDTQGPRLILSSNVSGEDQRIRVDVDAKDDDPLHYFSYHTIAERQTALADAQQQASELLSSDGNEDDEKNNEQQAAEKMRSLDPADNIPGWTETASGTLLDSYQSQTELAQQKAQIEQKVAEEKQALADRVARGEISAEKASDLAKENLSEADKQRLNDIESSREALRKAQQSVKNYRGMVEVQAAQDAKVRLDGVAELSSSNNIIENAVEGVSLTLKGVSKEGQPGTEIGVEYDRNSVRSDIEQFVASYNQFYQTAKALTGVNSITGEKGPLSGDSTVRGADSRLKSVFSTQIEQAPEEMKSLTELGVTTTRQGTLEINYAMLDRQINNHFTELEDFFGGRNGFAKRVEDAIHGLTGVTGSIRTREQTLTEQNRQMADDQTRLDKRMESLEQRTHDKFTAMQDATSKMQGQLSALQNALG
ncbi:MULTISPECIES: flagellar filament capping protein FliD [unclassified Vibrio]|uniref:Flagellar hook-associated protein 2 n=1 Tax=Vibrio sp. HB236076 TaxID=3232307 RepID=A0AB39HIH9_9VIBR|nr:flagellar filament capping protein FliD [Vibrio sp. HB161653]MDP5254807.1 flagellar filament capping protein FliD [Vibrio sp. HB161653]